MSTSTITKILGRKLGLVTWVVILLGGLAAGAASLAYVNETFDPPSLVLFGWQNPDADGVVANVSREYVSEGVGGSTAAQISAEFLQPGAYVGTMLYQKNAVAGNRLATLENTVLTFDLKTDRPDLQSVRVGLQSWSAYAGWSGPAYASIAVIPLGPYTPGEFKQVTVPLDDPLWIKDPEYPGGAAGPFDPTGKTYQIWIQVDGDSFPDDAELPVKFSVTIDNVKLTTKNPMVAWQSAGSGEVTPEGVVQEVGVAEHLGKYTSTIVFDDQGVGAVELKAANGDTLLGSLYMTSFAVVFPDLPDFFFPIEIAVDIEDGTGRFKGAKANYVGTLTWNDTESFTATAFGSLTTVGSNKK